MVLLSHFSLAPRWALFHGPQLLQPSPTCSVMVLAMGSNVGMCCIMEDLILLLLLTLVFSLSLFVPCSSSLHAVFAACF